MKWFKKRLPYIPEGVTWQGRQRAGRVKDVDPEMAAVLGIMTCPVAIVAVVAALVLIFLPFA